MKLENTYTCTIGKVYVGVKCLIVGFYVLKNNH